MYFYHHAWYFMDSNTAFDFLWCIYLKGDCLVLTSLPSFSCLICCRQPYGIDLLCSEMKGMTVIGSHMMRTVAMIPSLACPRKGVLKMVAMKHAILYSPWIKIGKEILWQPAPCAKQFPQAYMRKGCQVVVYSTSSLLGGHQFLPTGYSEVLATHQMAKVLWCGRAIECMWCT